MSTFEYLSFSWHVGAFLVHVVFDWEALFGELSWFGAKGAMEAAEREGLLSEEAADQLILAGYHGSDFDMFGWYSCFAHSLLIVNVSSGFCILCFCGWRIYPPMPLRVVTILIFWMHF